MTPVTPLPSVPTTTEAQPRELESPTADNDDPAQGSQSPSDSLPTPSQSHTDRSSQELLAKSMSDSEAAAVLQKAFRMRKLRETLVKAIEECKAGCALKEMPDRVRMGHIKVLTAIARNPHLAPELLNGLQLLIAKMSQKEPSVRKVVVPDTVKETVRFQSYVRRILLGKSGAFTLREDGSDDFESLAAATSIPALTVGISSGAAIEETRVFAVERKGVAKAVFGIEESDTTGATPLWPSSERVGEDCRALAVSVAWFLRNHTSVPCTSGAPAGGLQKRTPPSTSSTTPLQTTPTKVAASKSVATIPELHRLVRRVIDGTSVYRLHERSDSFDFFVDDCSPMITLGSPAYEDSDSTDTARIFSLEIRQETKALLYVDFPDTAKCVRDIRDPVGQDRLAVAALIARYFSNREGYERALRARQAKSKKAQQATTITPVAEMPSPSQVVKVCIGLQKLVRQILGSKSGYRLQDEYTEFATSVADSHPIVSMVSEAYLKEYSTRLFTVWRGKVMKAFMCVPVSSTRDVDWKAILAAPVAWFLKHNVPLPAKGPQVDQVPANSPAPPQTSANGTPVPKIPAAKLLAIRLLAGGASRPLTRAVTRAKQLGERPGSGLKEVWTVEEAQGVGRVEVEAPSTTPKDHAPTKRKSAKRHKHENKVTPAEFSEVHHVTCIQRLIAKRTGEHASTTANGSEEVVAAKEGTGSRTYRTADMRVSLLVQQYTLYPYGHHSVPARTQRIDPDEFTEMNAGLLAHARRLHYIRAETDVNLVGVHQKKEHRERKTRRSASGKSKVKPKAP